MQVEKRENLMEVLQSEIQKLREHRSLPKVEVRQEGVAYLVDRATRKPIPPGNSVGPVRVEVRLWSTRRGKAAFWIVGDGVTDNVVNRSPFNPMARFIAEKFAWYPPGARWVEDLSDRTIVQGGVEVVNWVAVVKEPLADPVRMFLQAAREVIREHEDWYLIGRQGHLTVYSLPRDLWDAAEELRREDLLIQQYRFFNHAFVPTNIVSLAWRTLRGFPPEAWSLIRVGKWYRRTECYVVSQDHPNEDVSLWEDSFFIASHPFPMSGDSVD